MATSQLAGKIQQALVLTSLLANVSDFAALDKMLPMASTSSLSVLPQYTPPASIDQGAPIIPNVKDPLAIVAQTVCPGYTASNIEATQYGITAQLTLAGDPCNIYGTDIHDLNLTVEYQAKSRFHINIKPSHITADNASWYELPPAWVPQPRHEDGTMENSDFVFTWTNNPTFGFNITQRLTDEVLFSTDGTKLVYENQFIEFATHKEAGYNVYGLGEVFRGLRLQPGVVRTIYATDQADNVDWNMYGSHPFYLGTKYYETAQGESSGYTSTSHGVYLRNAHGLEILTHDQNITWRALGGEIDLYLFSGPTQPEVTSQYLHQIGLPAMQQYWTFGYHQCRWGYQNWSMTEEVVNDFEKFDIPLETIWNDIDYMETYRDFVNDPVRFSYKDGAAFIERLHAKGMHYVPIVDAAIYAPNPENSSDTYEIFDDGKKHDVFLLNPDGTLYVGQVWPGYTVFPDWMSKGANSWWKRSVKDWYDNIEFDGLWIDMNEAASFCVGSCGSGRLELNPVHPWFKISTEPSYDYPEGFNTTNTTEAASASSASATKSAAEAATQTASASTTTYLRTKPTPGVRNINHPPYAINHYHGDLAVHAVSPNATHHNGVQQYDAHNLYGHQLLQNTYSALRSTMPSKRPFIIGRSTFVGSGNYSGHWGGDNKSRFKDMYFSIPQALSFSLFGIPMFGVDTCGFGGQTDEELCNRWMQLSAFFPFYRNHNAIESIDQEPYRWTSVLRATKTAMNIRFQLLPTIYTLFYYAHTRGDTVMRALAWEFPNDPSLADADRQFFLGPAVLVIPVLTQGHTTVDGVFPGLQQGEEIYYDWYNQSAIEPPSKTNTTIDAPLGHIPVYLRGGYILATQGMRKTTREARKTDWSLIVALGVTGRANGTLYLDDGESIMPATTKLVTFAAQVAISEIDGRNATKLRLDVFVDGTFHGLDLPLAKITVLGVKAPPAVQGIQINDMHMDGSGTVEYCVKRQVLIISDLQHVLDGKVWAKNWSLLL